MIYEVIDKSHIPTLADIYVQTYNAPPWNDQWTVPLSIQKLDELIHSRDAYGLVCKDSEGEIIGAIVGNSETYYDGTEFFIRDFFVLPASQGKGAGSALMNELESRLKDKGIAKVYLFTSRTDRTENYYQKRGYQSWNGMVLMGKALDEV